MCASVHVDRFDGRRAEPPYPYTRLDETPRSLIKGGVTRVFVPSLVDFGRIVRMIGRGDFYKSVSPRGLVYLFRRRRRRSGRGGRPGGIRAISKGGRNTAIFIRAAGMQSRSGAGAGRRSGRGGGHFEGSSFYSFFARGESSSSAAGARRALIAGVMRALDSTRLAHSIKLTRYRLPY